MAESTSSRWCSRFARTPQESTRGQIARDTANGLLNPALLTLLNVVDMRLHVLFLRGSPGSTCGRSRSWAANLFGRNDGEYWRASDSSGGGKGVFAGE